MSQRLDSSGVVVSGSVYDAYGAETTTGTAPTDACGYNAQWGYWLDRETGLYLCQARWYDPVTGRWVTRDPIGYAGGANLYGYSGGGPIGWVDPSGKQNEAIEGVLERLRPDLAKRYRKDKEFKERVHRGLGKDLMDDNPDVSDEEVAEAADIAADSRPQQHRERPPRGRSFVDDPCYDNTPGVDMEELEEWVYRQQLSFFRVDNPLAYLAGGAIAIGVVLVGAALLPVLAPAAGAASAAAPVAAALGVGLVVLHEAK